MKLTLINNNIIETLPATCENTRGNRSKVIYMLDKSVSITKNGRGVYYSNRFNNSDIDKEFISKFIDFRNEYKNNPIKFMKDCLGIKLYPYQEAYLRSMIKFKR